ncbi:beta-xylosidase [Rhodocytophaga rosea]|uniref:Beta-xylosidase n=1 Tax=Rhodocytophaga rosea TaxID=2704465 RepID=A0A6C0GE54_9BACT|nr:beta-xylosidase [Rhodocytophaga rosea]QHT66255.1 beta-xylosidase [Rhodocytophaga rosea]
MHQFAKLTILLLLVIFYIQVFGQSQPSIQPVKIQVDLNKTKAKMEPVWAWFGYDEPNYTYMKDGKKLLSELAALSPVPVYVRAHNLLTTGDGTAALKWGSTNAYTEDKRGRPVYNWTIVDSIFDTYIKRGMKPIAQIGFMPQALSIKPEPYRHHWQPGRPYKEIYTGWAYPPKNYDKWAELVYQWVKHCVERYGEAEVQTWLWELWNEPNIDYWQGTPEEFHKLYDYTAHAVKRACPGAKMGGPDSTGPRWDKAAAFLQNFLEHCLRGKNYATGKIGAPLDFIAFHAKGDPKVVDGHVRMNMGAQLRDISRGFEIVTSFPELKNLPIVIGESDPEGCAACGMQTNPENAYRNGTMYSSYTAASFARKYALADHFKANFKGAVSWSFEFENQPWFYGFRDLATNGVDKPVLNVFRMFGMMQGNRVEVNSEGAYTLEQARDSSIRGSRPDINALATKDTAAAAVMLWNYHDDDISAPAQFVELQVKGLTSKQVMVSHYRIDSQHSNAYEMWKKMGSPQQPTDIQIKELEKSGQLQLLTSPEWVKTKNGVIVFSVPLPGQAVSLLKLDW